MLMFIPQSKKMAKEDQYKLIWFSVDFFHINIDIWDLTVGNTSLNLIIEDNLRDCMVQFCHFVIVAKGPG